MAEQKKDVQFGPRMSERSTASKAGLPQRPLCCLWWLHWLLPVSSIQNL